MQSLSVQRRGILNQADVRPRNRLRLQLARDVGELQAVRPAGALGDDRVFPMAAWNAWNRVFHTLYHQFNRGLSWP